MDNELWSIYHKYYRGSTRDETLEKIADGFLEEVAWLFGWTEQQAYQATEFMFRPPNTN